MIGYHTGTLYKGLFLLIFVLILMEYFFGSITESKNYVFNNTKSQIQNFRSPLVKPSLMKSKYFNNTNNATHNNNTETFRIANVSLLTLNVNTASKNLSNLAALFHLSASEELDISNGTASFENKSKKENSVASTCLDEPPDLVGPIKVKRYPVPTTRQLETAFSWLMPGGHWKPTDCMVLNKVAVVVPFRSRGEHLLLFLQHMHPFLKKQQIDYTIFIVEQDGDGPFNRALLMNIGFTEAMKKTRFDCFIFHDIDLLPENDRNLYTCPIQPRHMSVAIDIFKYKLPYPSIFGGVSAISSEHFKLLNGFSNSFWGWGGEDDDMSNRIRHHKLFISRYPPSIARYTMLTHKKGKPSPNRFDILKHGQQKYDEDGLNSLKYSLLECKENLLYTWFLVTVEAPS